MAPAAHHPGSHTQIWSNTECYDAANAKYSNALPDGLLIKRLQPAAEYLWRSRYTEEAGRWTGGILLSEWFEKLAATQRETADCGLRGNDCSSAL